jgi:hypothetical protein
MSKEEENEKYFRLKKRNRGNFKSNNEKAKKIPKTEENNNIDLEDSNNLEEIESENSSGNENEGNELELEDEIEKACEEIKSADSEEILPILHSLTEKISLASDSISSESNCNLLLKELVITLDKFPSPEVSSNFSIK